jgi:chemotaxis protein methyltransferase CheR
LRRLPRAWRIPIVTPLDYDFLRKCLKERSGLVLSADKHYLVESRLLPLARNAGFGNLAELVGALRSGQDTALMGSVVEAMTTRESFFFRDRKPFEHLRRTIIPALTRHHGSGVIRIWCAAAAAGQEPYSIAICLKEMGRQIASWRFEIVATDLSNDALARARQGLYSQFEVQRGLPVKLLIKYFSQVGDLWQVAPEIRGMIKFQQFNLLTDFAPLGTFDVVFCRNVLIYFDQETKSDVLDRLAKTVSNDGYLVLGAAETAVGLTDAFRMVIDKPGLYMPPREGERLPAQQAAKYSRPRLVAISGRR